ncbi:MAG TPA: HEAT repeat domain-containing protein [Verrucomicrobiae bacterium]
MNLKICFQFVLAGFLAASSFAVFADDATDETAQIGVLQSQASPHDKDAACAWLKRHGTARSVPALAALLTNEQLSLSGRHALETMPVPEAENALIAALAQTSGLLKAGIVSSLGVRRDAAAVPELAKLLSDSNAQIAGGSATALGEIATPGALAALERQLKTSGSSAADAVVDGCLRCAHHLLMAGSRQQAFSVYQEVYQRPTKEFFHVAAFRGMAQSSENGASFIANAITNGPAAIQMAAVQLVHEKDFSGATKDIAALLPNANPLVQAALIDALNQRDDPAAVSEISPLAKNGEQEVRAAALAALGNLGDDETVPLLVEIAATPGDAGQAAARQALALIHRGTPNQALLKLLAGSKTDAQAEIVRALNNRGAMEATPQLLELAKRAEDPVRAATFQALARLADQPQLEGFVQIVGEMKTDEGRSAAADALGLACRHIQTRHGTVDFSPVLEALKNGSAQTRIALLPVCSSVANSQTRSALREYAADSSSDVWGAAIRALCQTADPELLPDIVKVAQMSDEEFRASAIEACVRLTTQEGGAAIPNSERVKYFQAIIPAASTTAEKRLALSGLAAGVTDARALKLAEPLLSDNAVSNETALAIIGISRRLSDTAAAKAALDTLIAHGASEQILQQARDVSKLVDARLNYITAWQIAGPYRQAGKNFTALFDIAFPPETADAQKANWQDVSLSDDPKSPWAVDLLAAFGGTQEVAYGRTTIHSDSEHAALLVVNSDDGVKVWLNGEVVHENNTSHALTQAPAKVKITLKPGWNNLLLKVTQNTQGWGFGARLTDADGAPLSGLQIAANPAQAQM